MSKEDYLAQSQEHDGVVEVETTASQDAESHAILKGKEDAQVPYNPVSNNCATNACDGLSPVTNTENLGKEKVKGKAYGYTVITKTTTTPNALFNDVAKLPGATIHKNPGNKTKVKFQEYIDNKEKK